MVRSIGGIPSERSRKLNVLTQEHLNSTLNHYATQADLNEGLGRLDTKISDTKSDIITWIVGTTIAIAAIVVVAAGIVIGLILSQ